MSSIAIIPARGGSKRIPHKNIKHFCGKPIIGYSIDAALNSGLFEEVMVSTDNEEIAQLAISLGAKVPFMRSALNANDYATTYDVIEEVIQAYHNEGKRYETSCCIYATAPFTTPMLLKQGFEKLQEGFDVVYPVTEFSFPIQRAVKVGMGADVTFFYPEYATTRSQDLEKAYHDTGQFYWFRCDSILNKKRLITDNVGAIVLSNLEVHDIDTMQDWEVAELKYNLLDKN